MAASQKFPAPGSGHWTVAGAKARLSEVIERAQTDPQIITRHGKPSVVIVLGRGMGAQDRPQRHACRVPDGLAAAGCRSRSRAGPRSAA